MRQLILVLLFAFNPTASAELILKTESAVKITPKDLFDLEYLEEWEAYTAMFDTLFLFDSSQKLIGLLVKDWVVSPLGDKITIVLKQGLKFSDGTPLTSKDVELTIKRAVIVGSNKTITNCLKYKPPTSLKEKFSSVEVINNEKIVLHIRNCAHSILGELANTNLGIVSLKNLDTSSKMVNLNVVSGAFIPKFESNRLTLVTNNNNWRLNNKKTSLKRIEIGLEDSKGPAPIVDFQRITSPNQLKRFKQHNYTIKYSVPTMTWYMSIPRSSFKNTSSEAELLRLIRESFTPSKIKYFNNNEIESPADSFFPKEYSCDSPSQISGSKTKSQKLTVYLLPHSSSESESFIDDLKTQLSMMPQIDVKIYRGSNIPKNGILLEIQRQFLGADISYVFNLLYSVFNNLPDPGGSMTKLNQNLQIKSGEERKLYLKKMCSEFSKAWQIPIAHRKAAFAVRNDKIAEMFSKTTGEINYNFLLEVL